MGAVLAATFWGGGGGRDVLAGPVEAGVDEAKGLSGEERSTFLENGAGWRMMGWKMNRMERMGKVTCAKCHCVYV